jgi:hypothetical protein
MDAARRVRDCRFGFSASDMMLLTVAAHRPKVQLGDEHSNI